MKTCATCGHYKNFTDKFDLDYHGKDAGTCDSKGLTYAGDTSGKVATNGLSYWDFESYSAGFYVGANFGCIHHSETSQTKEG